MRFRSPLACLAVVSLAFVPALLGACSSSEPEAGSGVSQVATDQTEFNAGDVEFAQNMIPHHQQAVEMAVIALDDARGASPQLKELASRIQGAQQPEIDLMTGWLESWGEKPSATMDHSDHSSMDGMEGMMSAEEMKALQDSSGADFDTLWMEMMIEHHEGAVGMAKKVQTDGKSADTKALAEKIIAAQEKEIAEMTGQLAK